MKLTKKLTGKDRVVKSAKDVRVGDAFQKIEGRYKSGIRKLSTEIYVVTEILPNMNGVEATYTDPNDGEEKTRRFAWDEMFLHTRVDVEVQGIRVDFTCRESGYQTQFVSEHDFISTNQDCEICGSHGDITIDIKCKCGNTHEIELKSW